jgi:prepilin-type N-terminal cleavage/methylation domain-containing protein/prepilin-type processing-associated H-X9-DG protein
MVGSLSMSHNRRGFTLRELLAVIAIICILLALLLPATRTAREAARRSQCTNHLRQLSIGLHNYHDTRDVLPSGARQRTRDDDPGVISWGSSWLVAILPFLEKSTVPQAIDAASNSAPQNDFVSAPVIGAVQSNYGRLFLCPSTNLPRTQTLAGTELVIPSYAGIMGTSDAPAATQAVVDKLGRLVPGPYGGSAAGNGMLLLNDHVKLDDCKDGAANVMLIGEVSDWYYHGRKRMNPTLSVANAGDGPHPDAGWLAGTNLDFKVETNGPPIPANRLLNLITIEHPVGTNGAHGAKPTWGTQGIGRCGLNNPLLSAHPAGALVAFADGHVRLLTKQTPTYILKRLAIRDDGGKLLPEDF